MRVLLLGPPRPHFIEYFQKNNDEIECCESPIQKELENVKNADFIISYGYRFLLKKDILDCFPNRAINLHISFLPWNKGADPNVWSILEDTPKGVTIHQIDEGLDTGDILIQKEIIFEKEDSLRSTYNRLTEEMDAMFFEFWPLLKNGQLAPQQQLSGGSLHFLKDRKIFEPLLNQGWDTKIDQIIGKLRKL
jgi:methionyl-tRNA formyltransferase